MASDPIDDILDVTLLVVETFEQLGIPYLVGGSIASSLHGIPRATQDVDIVADLRLEDVDDLVGALGETFYVDKGSVQEAVRRRASFNVIHLDSMSKVDVFILGDDVFFKAEMERRETYAIDESRSLVVASPEDVILHKLYWYQMSDEVSDRQWRDALGVVRVQADSLNETYLREMASHLGVSDLVERMLEEEQK